MVLKIDQVFNFPASIHRDLSSKGRTREQNYVLLHLVSFSNTTHYIKSVVGENCNFIYVCAYILLFNINPTNPCATMFGSIASSMPFLSRIRLFRCASISKIHIVTE